MASSTGVADEDSVKAGYWFSASNHPFEQIDPAFFTHLYAGFAVVHKNPINDKNGVITFPPDKERIFQTFPKIVRQQNTHDHKVKALLSIGGDQTDPKISDAIAYAVSDPNRRKRFISESIKLARDYKYDGLDLCWLYPSTTEQENQLASLLKEWRDAVNKEAATKTHDHRPKLLLTAAVFHHPVIPLPDGKAFSYPIEALSHNMDWINVLAIDFYSPSNSSKKTGPVHAWLNPEERNKCGSDGIKTWTESDKIETRKLVLSLPFYGYEWTLENPAEQYGFFAPAFPANTLPLEYRNIAHHLKSNEGTHEYKEEYVATYWYSGGTWIGFEDTQSIQAKIQSAAREKNLGGYFAWHVAADDDTHTLSKAASDAWPVR